jgi:2-phosphosulfolactate phosphatase
VTPGAPDAAAPRVAAVDVAFTVEELDRVPLEGRVVVVIDVVRASTTIVTALAHGAAAVVPVLTPEEARARAAARADGAILGGERGGTPPPGFDWGNSPAEYATPRVSGRTIVFTTTNGTRALAAAARAAAVAVGGFVNAGAIVGWIERRGGEVVLACSGETGRFCLEDATCAGLLAARLAARHREAVLSDSARAAVLLSQRYAGDLDGLMADAAWARVLVSRGRGADLPLCAALDTHGVVPVLSDGALVLAEAAGPIDRRLRGRP